MIETPERRRRRGVSDVEPWRATVHAMACVTALLGPSIACDAEAPSSETGAAAAQEPAREVDSPIEKARDTDTPELVAADTSPSPAGQPSTTAPAQGVGDLDARGARNALERAWMAHTGESSPPAEILRADRATMIYADPRFGSPFRGKLTHGESFGLFERVEAAADPECRGGWGRVGPRAFVCLEHTSPSKTTPRELPVVERGQLTPYFYARVRRKNANGEVPLAPRWASRSAMLAGADPIDHLVPDHDYAFERRRPSRDGAVLVDGSSRVVREADVRRLEPSAFEGRDTVARPLPDEGRLAWSLVWPHASVRADTDVLAPLVGQQVHQAEFFVTDEVVRRRGIDWVAVVGDTKGWVDAEEIRRWYPAARPSDLGDDELWIDVELEQQTLAVMLGDAPLFVTMIASGNHKHPTPQGIFRIKTKMSTSTMDSQPGDEEAYAVEGVPWAQFFYKRYGLHGTFWHNRFGRRTSHGCVNLSAKDAALVYAMTTPDPLPGWAMAFAHDDAPGTVVRVRKMDGPVPDRRGDPEPAID